MASPHEQARATRMEAERITRALEEVAKRAERGDFHENDEGWGQALGHAVNSKLVHDLWKRFSRL